MRFTRFQIDAFGRLRRWDSGPIPGNLVVVFGPNEAGKSTLFHFLSSLLFGIHPTERDKHPYAPWDGSPLSGQAELQLRDGTVVRVYRRLANHTQGRVEYVAPDGVVTGEDLRNRPLPPAAHIPQQVFEEVFALTLEELRFPREEAWSVIDQKLLGNLAADFLRPVRQVIQELQEEADRLWKPNRRGKHREKEIEAELGRLQELRQEAAARDREIREAHRQRQQLEARVQELTREEQQLKVQLRRAERLLPVRRTLLQIQDLEKQAGDLTPWQHLPDDPLQAAAQLQEQLSRLERTLQEFDEQARREREHVAAFTRQDQHLIAHEADLQAAAGALAELESIRARLAGLREERERLRLQVLDRAQRLLAVPWEPGLAGPILQVPEAELRARLRAWRETDERYREARARTAGVRARQEEPQARPSYVGGVLLATLGLAVSAFGGLAANDVLLWAGVILCLLSATQLWGRWRERRRLREEQLRWRQRERECLVEEQRAASERDESLRQVERLLAAVPVAPARLESPDETLLVDLQEIQAPLRMMAQLDQESRRLQEQLRRQLDSLNQLLSAVRPDGEQPRSAEEPLPAEKPRPAEDPRLAEQQPHSAGDSPAGAFFSADQALAEAAPASAALEVQQPSPEESSAEEPSPEQSSPGEPAGEWHEEPDAAGLDELAPVFWRIRQELQSLPSLLAEAHHRRRRAEAAREALESLDRRIRATAAERDAVRRRLQDLEASLAALGGSTLSEQAGELRRRRKALHDAQALREHLRRHHPDLDQLVEEIRAADEAGEGWRADDAFIVRAHDRLQAIVAEIQEARQEVARLEERIRTLERQTTLDDIDGEIAALEEERSQIRRERDRLMLLVHVLTEAEQRFREEHQPDVLRRAGEYLEAITGGRYLRLLVEETPEGRKAWVKQAGNPHPIDLRQRLSRGTFDQIYLALRLALVDHLDAGQEPLPLFLDEVLVNWDGYRRARGLRLLAQLSARRQVFVFTCHENLARELTGALQAWRLDMPAPSAEAAEPGSLTPGVPIRPD